ncbi:hypothetical protein Hypma_014248 [Hypsizygus marmoreus]|uniref:Uncharacterized protein n=1 Tax=Hypsizygus marmoreus TaxID=39966 RepID=A0A369JIA4_HYPMA|nr:hypothetical protein Hypma_014248 [Hypsizygus marmoreus]
MDETHTYRSEHPTNLRLDQGEMSQWGIHPQLHRRIEFEAGTSNHVVLSEPETTVAKFVLSNAERDFQAFDIQFAELARKRDQDAVQLDRLRAAIAPHKRLPTEILSFIFLLSTGNEPINIPLCPESCAPWMLRQVCSRWRSIILDDRRIWNDILVNLETDNGKDYAECEDINRSARVLDIILPKSGPLTFGLRIDGSTERTQKALELLLTPFPSRIVNIYIALYGDRFPMFHAMLRDQFTSLKSLELEFTDSMTVGRSSISAFPRSLQTFSISGDRTSYYAISYPHINWSNITELNISILHLSFSRLHRILKHCINLRICDVSVHLGIRSVPSQQINLPRLHSLTILLDHGTIFYPFTLPSLSSLDISHKGLFPAAEITAMIQRSGCALQELHVDERKRKVAECDPKALGALFVAAPSLREVCLLDIVVPNPILERIREGDLLPRLTVFKCRLNAETLGTFLDVIERRMQENIPGTSTCELRYATGMFPQDLGLLSDMQSVFMRATEIERIHGKVIQAYHVSGIHNAITVG